jgi:hypothetical protein
LIDAATWPTMTSAAAARSTWLLPYRPVPEPHRASVKVGLERTRCNYKFHPLPRATAHKKIDAENMGDILCVSHEQKWSAK